MPLSRDGQGYQGDRDPGYPDGDGAVSECMDPEQSGREPVSAEVLAEADRVAEGANLIRDGMSLEQANERIAQRGESRDLERPEVFE